ncbi:MAG: hypothetical protein JWO60_2610 [Frankiales bacterium]|nr:hypothetical protein [Frankiales bacterium]
MTANTLTTPSDPSGAPVRRRLVSALALGVAALALPAAQAAPLPVPSALASRSAAVPPVGTPVFAENLDLVGTFPEAGAISTAFDPDRPFMYVNTLSGITVYDISDPEQPLPAGNVPLPHFENERMTFGKKADGTRFVLVGYDLVGVDPSGTSSTNAGSGYQLVIVDVTDPAAPEVRSEIATTTTSVHTVHCIAATCDYAYSAGAYDNGKFTIFDLRDLDAPKELKTLPSTAGSGHQWDYDDAGLIWHSGFGGVGAYDITDPTSPKPLNSTNGKGVAGASEYNDFILHNAFRPNAKAFDQQYTAAGTPVDSGAPDIAKGNVLLATEEDYDSPDCQGTTGVDAPEGGFSTWRIPYLDNAQYKKDNSRLTPGKGTIEPLDIWNTEIANTGVPTPAGALCSAHYFTVNEKGYVAQSFYGQGTRILDVSDAKDIKQVGYFFVGAMESWISYWVPSRDASGKVVPGKFEDLIYTNDVVRGIDVLKFTPPAAGTEVEAPVLSQWLGLPGGAAIPRDKAFGYLCRPTPALGHLHG